MNIVKLLLDHTTNLPEFHSKLAVGADVRAMSILTAYTGSQEITPKRLEVLQKDFSSGRTIKIRAHERILFGTGISIADMAEDKEIQVRSRSGFTLKTGLIVANSPGTIDPDYRGGIAIILLNSTSHLASISIGDRIAQIVVKSREDTQYVETDYVTFSERGTEGFGSTGTK